MIEKLELAPLPPFARRQVLDGARLETSFYLATEQPLDAIKRLRDHEELEIIEQLHASGWALVTQVRWDTQKFESGAMGTAILHRGVAYAAPLKA